MAILVGGADGLTAGWLLFCCRGLFFLPWLALGRVYATLLRSRVERVGLPVYFAVVMAVQLALAYLTDGSLTYTPSWCRFPNGVALTYLVTANGIAFWWGVCRFVVGALGERGRRLVDEVGSNTFSIMAHLYLGFFLLKCLFFVAHCLLPALGSLTSSSS